MMSAWLSATSIPISTVYSQALLGLLTRPIVRNTEFELRQAGDHQVGLVAMRHRDDGAGTADPRGLEHVRVGAVTEDQLSRWKEAAELSHACRVALDQRHGPACIEQQAW